MSTTSKESPIASLESSEARRQLFVPERDIASERKAALLAELDEESQAGGEIYRDPEAFARRAAALAVLFPDDARAQLERAGAANVLMNTKESTRLPMGRNLKIAFPDSGGEHAEFALREEKERAAGELQGLWQKGDLAAFTQKAEQIAITFPDTLDGLEIESGKPFGEAREEVRNRMTEALTMARNGDDKTGYLAQARAMRILFPENINEIVADAAAAEWLASERGSSPEYDADLALLSASTVEIGPRTFEVVHN